MTGEPNRAKSARRQVHLKVWRDKTREVSWRPQDPTIGSGAAAADGCESWGFRMMDMIHGIMDHEYPQFIASYEVCMDGLWFMNVYGL